MNSYSEQTSVVFGDKCVPERPVVCVQGLGFVGAAMAAAVTAARDSEGKPYFNAIGVDLSTPEGRKRISAINDGQFPFPTADEALKEAMARAYQTGNLLATSDPEVYALASVVVVDIPLDVDVSTFPPTCRLEGFREGIRSVGRFAQPGTLVIVETTVPPGTTEMVVCAELQAAASKRGLRDDAFLVAHSYERVMPGRDYLNSIVNFWRVFAGASPQAGDACEAFLSKVVNVAQYPLRRLKSTTASETAKILENSYRAATIALMEEWGRFAEAINIDLFEVIDAIRVRPTHSNMRQPGFGVGGYCLTKDPLFMGIAARELFGMHGLAFPFADLSMALNQKMPLVSLNYLERELGGLQGRKLLILGVSYRPDVGDTRYSPTEVFAQEALHRGAELVFHDPLVEEWPETGFVVLHELPSPEGFDAVVFATAHEEYLRIDLSRWLAGACPRVFDANHVLSDAQLDQARQLGCPVFCIGRGTAE